MYGIANSQKKVRPGKKQSCFLRFFNKLLFRLFRFFFFFLILSSLQLFLSLVKVSLNFYYILRAEPICRINRLFFFFILSLFLWYWCFKLFQFANFCWIRISIVEKEATKSSIKWNHVIQHLKQSAEKCIPPFLQLIASLKEWKSRH